MERWFCFAAACSVLTVTLALGSGCSSGPAGSSPDGGTSADGGGGADGGNASDSGVADGASLDASGFDGGPGALSYFSMGGRQIPYIQGRTFDPSTYLTDGKPKPGKGTIYYVDGTSGDDGRDGKSVASAFKTLGKGTSNLAPGDTLYILKGLYRVGYSENTALHFSYQNGTAKDRILVSSYGDGPVVIDGSTLVDSWALDSGAVYKASVSFPVGAVVTDDVPLVPAASRQAMTAGTWYVSGGTLYVWTTNGQNPSTTDLGVIHNIDSNSSYLGPVNTYESTGITFYGLTVRFSMSNGIVVDGDDIVQNCQTMFNEKNGVSVNGSGNQLIKTLGFFNTMENWPRGYNGFSSGGWAGAFNSTAVAALIQGNINFHSGGEGITLSDGKAIDNINVDSFSVGYYIMTYGDVPANATGVTLDHNYEICEPPEAKELFAGTASAVQFDVKKRMIADGITTGNEFAPNTGIHNVSITDNVVIGCKHGYKHNQENSPNSGIDGVTFVNNTIVTPAATFLDPSYPIVGLSLGYNGGKNSGSVFRNNIVYVLNSADHALEVDPDGDAPSKAAAFQGLTIDHNLYFKPGSTSAFFIGAASMPLSGFVTSSGGTGEVWADPLVKDATIYAIDGVALLPGSPAIGAGTSAPVTTDYFYLPRTTPLDLGALQH